MEIYREKKEHRKVEKEKGNGRCEVSLEEKQLALITRTSTLEAMFFSSEVTLPIADSVPFQDKEIKL